VQVGLGLPVIKVPLGLSLHQPLNADILQNIWLLTLNAKPYDNSIATSVATELRFGTWGWCAVGCVLSQTAFKRYP
jgi:hypothetical protein